MLPHSGVFDGIWFIPNCSTDSQILMENVHFLYQEVFKHLLKHKAFFQRCLWLKLGSLSQTEKVEVALLLVY